MSGVTPGRLCAWTVESGECVDRTCEECPGALAHEPIG